MTTEERRTMTTTNFSRHLGLGLSALLVIGCTGDDTSTSSATDTEGSTGETDGTTTNTTPGTTTNSTSNSSTMTMGTGSESMSTTMTSETDTTMGTTMSTTMSTTDMTTTMGGVCGDGVLDPGEQCDEGKANGTMESMCTVDCSLIPMGACGDGVIDVGEQCDDGNTDDGDGCSATCAIEMTMDVCGDGMVSGDELCDDGNSDPDDGCEPDCTPSAPGICGDNHLSWDEICDDGNLMNGDGCEDDCTPTPLPACQPPENYISCDSMLKKNDPLAPYQAIGLQCNDKPNESIQISGTKFNSPDSTAWQIIKGYGTYMEMGKLVYGPREGEAFVIMSTGKVSQPNGQGILTEAVEQNQNHDNNNPDDNAFLPGYVPADDQAMVLAPQWSKGGSDPNDKIWWSFKTKTPTGTKAYAIDFAFFSSEWPTWVNTQYNDLFVAWQVSEDFVGSISVIDGLSTTITSLHPHWSDVPIGNPKTCAHFGSNGPGYSCNEPQLQGTGYSNHAATAWVRINQPIEEAKDLELFFFLADMGDTALASAVIIDRFRFSCDECIPADDPQCTGEVPDPNCCGVVLPT
jgi:cysteine-rich repeat protein